MATRYNSDQKVFANLVYKALVIVIHYHAFINIFIILIVFGTSYYALYVYIRVFSSNDHCMFSKIFMRKTIVLTISQFLAMRRTIHLHRPVVANWKVASKLRGRRFKILRRYVPMPLLSMLRTF